jgi:transposase
MIQISPTMRILVAIEPVDLRKGIDGLAQFCREKLAADPFSGCLFIFRSRRGTGIKVLGYDGQGYWLAQKRLSKGRFRWWPEASEPAKSLEAYEAQLLMAAGDVSRVRAAPMWRRVNAPK